MALNWTDGYSTLGSSTFRPGEDKVAWLEETTKGVATEEFDIYQIYDNFFRHVLSRVGGRTERWRETIQANRVKKGLYRSRMPWKIPAATGLRLRALYEFRNDFEQRSPQLRAHRFATLEPDVEGGVRLGLGHLLGAAVGVKGKGRLKINTQFAVDPVARVSVLHPWQTGGPSLRELVRESFAELSEEVEDPSAATATFEEIFADFLPENDPGDWTFRTPETITGDPGQTVPISLEIEAPGPGRSLIAVQIQDVAESENLAVSEIFALEANERGELFLLRGSEIGASGVAVTYGQGSLAVGDLQTAVDAMWLSLESDPDLSASVEAAGIDVGELSTTQPLRIEPAPAGAFDTPAIVLTAASRVALHLWGSVFLPRLRQRYGADALRKERQRENA